MSTHFTFPDLQLVVHPAPMANPDMPIASGYVPWDEVIFRLWTISLACMSLQVDIIRVVSE